MPVDLDVLTFYPDGGAPEKTMIPEAAISDRWFSVCADILGSLGPVFKHNMGSTLSHFDVHMAGPMGRLLLNGTPCYEFAISRGTAAEQDAAAVEHFAELVLKAWQVAEAPVVEDAQVFLDGCDARPSLLLLDYCRPEMDDGQKLALGQLGIHLASAYLDYCNEA